MAGTGVRLDTRGFAHRLRQLSAGLAGLTDVLASEVESQTRARFESQTAPDGRSWQPWSPATAATRHAGHSLLVSTGELRDSLTYRLLTDDTAEIGSRLEYAATHQFGAPKGSFGKRSTHGRPLPGGDIPARPFLGLSDQDRADLRALARRHLQQHGS